MDQNEELGRFGHHPDPAIDFFIEVERIEGMAAQVRAALKRARGE